MVKGFLALFSAVMLSVSSAAGTEIECRGIVGAPSDGIPRSFNLEVGQGVCTANHRKAFKVLSVRYLPSFKVRLRQLTIKRRGARITIARGSTITLPAEGTYGRYEFVASPSPMGGEAIELLVRPRTPMEVCAQVLTCGRTGSGRYTWFPTPCAALDEGATKVDPGFCASVDDGPRILQ